MEKMIFYAEEIYMNYEYLGLDKDSFILLVKENYDKFDDSVKSNYSKCLKMIVKEYLNTLDDKILVINRYINKDINSFNDYDKCIKEISKLVRFLTNIGYEINLDTIIELINMNSILFNLLLVIVTDKFEVIKADKLDEVISDKDIITFVEAFCVINNIDICEIEKLIKINLTKENGNSLELYMKDLWNISMLSSEENKLLFERLAMGELEVKQRIIEGNLPLVIYYAKKYLSYSSKLEIQDHIQNGNMGLIRAVDKLDVRKGYKFSTYASCWIKSCIERGIEQYSRTIRVPANIFEKQKKLRKCEELLKQKYGSDPTAEEIATELGITKKEVLFIYSTFEDAISLYDRKSVRGENDDDYILHQIADETDVFEDAMKTLLSEDVRSLLKNCGLTSKEIEILMLIYNRNNLEQLTMSDIGERYNITKEAIRQIEVKALKKIRKSENIKRFAVYMANEKKAEEFIDFCRAQYMITPYSTKRLTQEDLSEEYKYDIKYLLKSNKHKVPKISDSKVDPIFKEINKLILTEAIDLDSLFGPKEEILIVQLAFGCYKDKYYPAGSISTILDIPLVNVLEVINKMLLSSKKFFGMHDKGKIMKLVDKSKKMCEKKKYSW